MRALGAGLALPFLNSVPVIDLVIVAAQCTRGWCKWVIGQTGVIKCMLIHTFYDPCLSDHQRTPRVTQTTHSCDRRLENFGPEADIER